MRTFEECKKEAKRLAAFSKTTDSPSAFEIVKLAHPSAEGEIFSVQRFGIHALYPSHTLLHVEQIPD